MQKVPSENGRGLVNLIAEIERKLRDDSPSPGLAEPDLVPEAETIVLVLFDGLGLAHLDHPDAGAFKSTLASGLQAPFPSTTSVSLATVASARPPREHGQIGHLTWFPDLGRVVNTLKWVDLAGSPVPYDYPSLLPGPNLWERLRAAGIEPITVQPGDFTGSPLSRAIYRGARFEGAWDAEDLVDATVTLAREPGRFVFTYVPFVDVAGHVFGQGGEEFASAMTVASRVWTGILAGAGPDVTVLGTSDHGLMEVTEADKILIRDRRFRDMRFAGDSRGVQVWGDASRIEELAEATGGALADPVELIGPGLEPATLAKLGERMLLAPNGRVLLPKAFDKRLRCYHGGMTDEELGIPLLVG